MPRFALTCAPLRRAQYVVRTLEGFICVDDLHSFINRLPNVRPSPPELSRRVRRLTRVASSSGA
jgi:hypothetical protein